MPTAESVKLVPEVPFDQVTVPAHSLAVSVSVDGEQTDKVTGGVIVGADGVGFTVTALVATLPLTQLVVSQAA